MGELPIAAVDRIIRKSSGLRVSEGAAKILADHLEDVGMKIAQEAAMYSKHAGRKTVVDEDIRLVLKKWFYVYAWIFSSKSFIKQKHMVVW